MTDNQPHNPDYSDSDDVVSIDQTTLQRDSESGELLPQKVWVDEFGGDIIARPLTRDERKRYIEDLLDEDHEKEELSDSELAELFDRKVVEPDLTDHRLNGETVTTDFVRDGLNQTQEDGYFIAVLLASDEDRLVRYIRGDYTDSEIRMAAAQSGNLRPAGDRDRNEARRDRRQQSNR